VGFWRGITYIWGYVYWIGSARGAGLLAPACTWAR